MNWVGCKGKQSFERVLSVYDDIRSTANDRKMCTGTSVSPGSYNRTMPLRKGAGSFTTSDIMAARSMGFGEYDQKLPPSAFKKTIGQWLSAFSDPPAEQG